MVTVTWHKHKHTTVIPIYAWIVHKLSMIKVEKNSVIQTGITKLHNEWPRIMSTTFGTKIAHYNACFIHTSKDRLIIKTSYMDTLIHYSVKLEKHYVCHCYFFWNKRVITFSLQTRFSPIEEGNNMNTNGASDCF